MPQLGSGAARDKQGILLPLIRLSGHSPGSEGGRTHRMIGADNLNPVEVT